MSKYWWEDFKYFKIDIEDVKDIVRILDVHKLGSLHWFTLESIEDRTLNTVSSQELSALFEGINTLPEEVEHKVSSLDRNMLELSMLNGWIEHGVERVYKYKNRIFWYRCHIDGLTDIELYNDLSNSMFRYLLDLAEVGVCTGDGYDMTIEEMKKRSSSNLYVINHNTATQRDVNSIELL